MVFDTSKMQAPNSGHQQDVTRAISQKLLFSAKPPNQRYSPNYILMYPKSDSPTASKGPDKLLTDANQSNPTSDAAMVEADALHEATKI